MHPFDPAKTDHNSILIRCESFGSFSVLDDILSPKIHQISHWGQEGHVGCERHDRLKFL